MSASDEFGWRMLGPREPGHPAPRVTRGPALTSRITLRDVLGVSLVAGFMASLGLLFWVAIPKPNEQLIIYMLGQLSGFVGAVVAFHYTMNALNVKATANTGELIGALRAQAERADRPDLPDFPPRQEKP